MRNVMNGNGRGGAMLRRIGIAAVTGALLALAGCGGGGNDNNNGTANNGGSSAQTDSFIVLVNNIITNGTENGDLTVTDTITATSPDQSEPVPLG